MQDGKIGTITEIVPKNGVFMPDRIFYLNEMPRLLDRPFRLRSISWMPDHLSRNRNSILNLPHICCSFHPGPGVGRSVINGVIREFSGPQSVLSILPAGTRIDTIVARKHDELMFTVDPEYFEPLMNMIHPVPGRFQMTRHIDGILREIFAEMELIYLPGTADRMDGLFLRLLEEITLAIAGRTGMKKIRYPEIYEIASYLSAHYMENVSLEEVCRNYSVSPRTFYRRWRECFQQSPAEFLLEKRIVCAEHLLSSTDLGIQTIAVKSGFGNPLYFSQCFRRLRGMTPSRYRRTMCLPL